MELNLTFICIILLTLFMIVRGYKKGMTKEISGLVALLAGLVVLALTIMLSSSFSAGEMTNTVYTVILFVVFGIAYGMVKFVLRSAKIVSKLPILHFLDAVMGSVVGICKSVVIVWIVFLLCENNLLGTITEQVQSDIARSAILTMLYEYNLFISVQPSLVL